MEISADLLIQKFIRTYPDCFTAKDFSKMLSKFNIKQTVKEVKSFLDNSSSVIEVCEGIYKTRSGIFTNNYFSFKPTKREVENKCFIAGDRCIPFVDPEYYSFGITFVYKKEPLKRKMKRFPSEFLLDNFKLFGSEYSVQYIASDPAVDEKIDISGINFALPSEIRVTGFSLDKLIQDGFKYGDRILCKVVDWDENIVEIEILKQSENPFEDSDLNYQHEQWISEMEKNILSYLEIIGPRNSIEEQLAYVFMNNIEDFCNKNCASLGEMFSKTKKLGFESFGVESRIWKLGESVPAVGMWNKDSIVPCEAWYSGGKKYALEALPEYLEKAVLTDMIYSNSTDFEAVFDKLYPLKYLYVQDHIDLMLLHLKSYHDILEKTYNRFADYEIGAVRHSAVELFADVNELICQIDVEGESFTKFPQQPLIILSQIFSHISKIIEMIVQEPAQILKDKGDIELSLEGMRFNFEGVSEELKVALKDLLKEGFILIKKNADSEKQK